MKNTIRFPLVLGIICLVAAAGVGGMYVLTRPEIEAREKKARERAFALVFGPGVEVTERETSAEAADVSKPARVTLLAEVRRAGNLTGYAAIVETKGYAAEKIRMMVGTDPRAERIIGINIISQKETPGLGSRVDEVESHATWWKKLTGRVEISGEPERPWFQKQFGSHQDDSTWFPVKNLPPLEDTKRTQEVGGTPRQIQAITGATITTKAVIRGIHEAIAAIRRVKDSGTAHSNTTVEASKGNEPAR